MLKVRVKLFYLQTLRAAAQTRFEVWSKENFGLLNSGCSEKFKYQPTNH
ncbi:hypothetical protein IQ264_11795 [Phormidium sp. LEGE 05292]|nr:hypothetical protein [Phormidium sp. LEGE 05292]MBE9226107.1 hypothetical protein [Phormidium sp. LEGE 05292]